MWGLPRATHSVYARWLSSGHSSFRKDLLSRWPKFLRSLMSGPSPEAATLARVAAADRRSITAANNALLLAATGLSAWTATVAEVRAEPQRQETSTVDYMLELLQTQGELSLQCDN